MGGDGLEERPTGAKERHGPDDHRTFCRAFTKPRRRWRAALSNAARSVGAAAASRRAAAATAPRMPANYDRLLFWHFSAAMAHCGWNNGLIKIALINLFSACVRVATQRKE